MRYAQPTPKFRLRSVIIILVSLVVLVGAWTVAIFVQLNQKPDIDLAKIASVLPVADAWQLTANQRPSCATADLKLLGTWKNRADKQIRITAETTSSGKSQAAYQSQILNFGSCPGSTNYLKTSYQITGLGEAAAGISVIPGKGQPPNQIISARSKNLVVTISSPDYSISDLAGIIAKLFELVSDDKHPNNFKVTPTAPLPAIPNAWLLPADLPQIGSPQSYWYGSNPDSDFDNALSQCELMNFGTVTGPVFREHRTLVLVNDGNAPDFGIDAIRLQFKNSSDANSFAEKLQNNISKCSDRFVATKVTKKETENPGVFNFAITQKIETMEIASRVSIMTKGAYLLYLFNNESDQLKFSDQEWDKVLIRAGQRLSQIK